ncbi:YfaZ family outer membrane protein [Litchfieldella xinjiangensis]|uniref:YfaZ family outer membrane protein n=1 Tax=Litchfieldella xinjiangensis TaxID=1166948 RepID=UPI0005BA6DD8|nr:YfaZ family outer membrane protein [Halomonas xinjiangensis]
MKKRSLWSAVLLGAMFCQGAIASSLDLNLSSDAIGFEAAGEIAPGIALGGGILRSEYREDATMGHIQLLGVERNGDIDIGVGARWSQFETDYGDGGGLGLGGYGYVYLPQMPGVSLGGYGFYSPSVATSSDLDDSFEYGLRARYAFTRNVDGYVGYRRLRADFDTSPGTQTLDSGAHAGVRLNF